jgi:hypothetical protein
MLADVLRSKPDAFVLTMDGAVMQDVGKNGVITTYAVAERLRRVLSVRYPANDVALFGCYTFKKAQVNNFTSEDG